MTDHLPTVDDILGQPQAAPLPTVDDVLGPDKTYETGMMPVLGNIMKSFADKSSAVFNSGEGAAFSPEAHAKLVKEGWINAPGESNFGKTIAQGIYDPAAIIYDAVMRPMTAGFAGFQAAAIQGGQEIGQPALGRDIALLPEAFPVGVKMSMGLPHPPEMVPARAADAVGVPESVYMGTREATPEQVVSRDQAAAQMPAEVPEAPPADIHQTARNIAPETFASYDALDNAKNDLRSQLQDAAEQRRIEAEANAPHAAEIADLEAKLQDANARKSKIYQERLDQLIPERDAYLNDALSKDTDLMAGIRERLQKTDYEMRDLSPEVSAAYRTAREQFPEEPPQEATAQETLQSEPTKPAEPPPAPAITEEQRTAIANDVVKKLKATGRPEEEAQAAAQIVAEHYKARAERFGGAKGNAWELYAKDGPNIKAGKGKAKARELAQAQDIFTAEDAAATLAPEQPKNIYADIDAKVATMRPDLRKLRLASLNKKINAGIVTTREMYEREALANTFNQSARGKIRLATDNAKATITLMKSADASTFIHETGHHWLDELMKDAEDPHAPDGLKKDAETVRKWLGVESGEIPTRAHEKFARGFERYLMEGTAPSKALANVFAKFKEWLTAIYKTVDKLRSPISDDIRHVFDRLLSSNPERTVITPEREPVIPEAAVSPAPSKGADIAEPQPAAQPAKPIRSEIGGKGVYEKIPQKPLSLSEWVRKNGGIKDEGGDIRHILGGETGNRLIKPKAGKLADDLALKAWEEGFFPEKGERPTLNEFLDKLTEDLKGQKQYSSHDEAALHDYNNAIARNGEIDKIANEFGIDTAGKSHSEFWDAVAEKTSAAEQEKLIVEKEAASKADFEEAQRKEKEWLESRGEAWEPEEITTRTLEDLENERRQEIAAREAKPSTEIAGEPQPSAGDQEPVQAGGGQSGRGHEPSGRAGEAAGAESGRNDTDRQPGNPNAILGKPASALVDKAGNIRLDNLNAPEDVNRVLRETADANADFMDARRGVVSDAQVLNLADALGMDPAYLDRRKIGEAFNAEQIVAARKLLIKSAISVRDAMAKAATGTDSDIMAYAEVKTRHQMIQEQVSGITAEAGRALRAFRELEGSGEAKVVGEFLKTATGKDLFQLQQEAQLGMQLDTPQKVSKFIHDSKKPTFMDMMLEYWNNAILSGPQTHITNMLSNMLVSVNSAAETLVASGVGKILNSEDRVALSEAKGRLFGILQGAQDGAVAAAHAFKTESADSMKMEQRRFQSIPSAKVKIGGREMEIGGKQIRIPGRLLMAEDELFKAIASRQELNALAYRQATKEGLEGQAFAARVADIVTNPTEEMMIQAKKSAEYQTFTSPLGPTGMSVQRFANSHPLLKFVIPFIRTPTNILKFAAERTPLGLFSAEVRANLAGEKGTVARDTQIARMALGTTIGLATISMAINGQITGGGPADSKQKALLYQTGWQPYSVKIGDTYYSYARMEPLGTIMGVSADMVEITKAMEDPETKKLAAMIFASITKNLTNKTFLQGPSNLIQATSDPDRYGSRYVDGFIASFVPNVMGQFARTQDPIMREARTLADQIKSRIPGMSESLMPRRNLWGEPIAREGGIGPDYLSPIYQSPEKNDPIAKKLLTLGIYPSKLDRKILGIPLTDKQYDDYSRIAGKMTKMMLSNLMQPGFDSAPPATQIEMVKKAIEHARETARNMVKFDPANRNIIQQATEAKQSLLKKDRP